MTVQQLIELLASYLPELRLVVNGYLDGFDDAMPECFPWLGSSSIAGSIHGKGSPWRPATSRSMQDVLASWTSSPCLASQMDRRHGEESPSRRSDVVTLHATVSAGLRPIAHGDIAEVGGGGTPSTAERTTSPGMSRGSHPRALWNPRLIHQAPAAEPVAEGARRLLHQASTRAPIGYVALAKSSIATIQGFHSLVAGGDAISEYFYYWLKKNTGEWERHASGTTFRELSGSSLKTILLPLPPAEEQRAVARGHRCNWATLSPVESMGVHQLAAKRFV